MNLAKCRFPVAWLNYDFREQGKSLLIICKDHGDKLTGEECPYCRIATLEKVAEAAVEDLSPWEESITAVVLRNALRAAGYLKEQGRQADVQ